MWIRRAGQTTGGAKGVKEDSRGKAEEIKGLCRGGGTIFDNRDLKLSRVNGNEEDMELGRANDDESNLELLRFQ